MSDLPAPWVLLSQRSEKDYRVFKTRTLDVADPRNTKQYVRTVIDAPDWINLIAVTPQNEVILVRQFRFGVWANTLEIVGGMVDPGENPLETAARELEEETGYRAAKIVKLGSSHPNPAIQGNRLHSFLATGCVRVNEGHPDSSEDIRVELMPREHLREAVCSGLITHSLVLAALLLDAWATSPKP